MTASRFALRALVAATALTAFAAPAAAQRVNRIVTFGDSYADDGNFFELAGVNPATTGAYTTGRFSGGTNYVDTLSTILGAPVSNFAIGGARTNNSNQSNPFNWGFTYEVDQFLQLGTDSPVFPNIAPRFQSGDLVTVSIGGNDGRSYQQGGGTVAGAAAAANTAVAAATGNLNRLVAAGAPTISFLAGNTGVLPEVQYAANPALAAQVRTAFSDVYASGMQQTLAGYAANGVMVHYLDLTAVLGQIQANPSAYGINAIACPAFPAPLGPGVPGSTACIVSSNGFLVYGDQLHLTSQGFAIVANYVAAQLQAPLTLGAPSAMTLDTARNFGRTLTTRMETASPRDGDMPEGLHGFIVGDALTHRYDDTRTSDNFRTTDAGLTLGADYGFGSGVIGIAANFGKLKAHVGNDSFRDKGQTTQIGAYGSFGIAGGFVQAYAGYGSDNHDLTRRGVATAMTSNPDGHHTTAGIKAGYLMSMGAVRVGPVIALDHAHSQVDTYREGGDPALNLNVSSITARSLRGSIGAELRGDFAPGGLSLRPFAQATVEKELRDNDRTFRFAQQSATPIVNHYTVEGDRKKAYGRLAGGLSAELLSNIRLDAALTTTLGMRDGNENAAHLGLRVGF